MSQKIHKYFLALFPTVKQSQRHEKHPEAWGSVSMEYAAWHRQEKDRLDKVEEITDLHTLAVAHVQLYACTHHAFTHTPCTHA